MFHWRDSMFFGRLSDGSVRVLKFPRAAVGNDFPKAERVPPGMGYQPCDGCDTPAQCAEDFCRPSTRAEEGERRG